MNSKRKSRGGGGNTLGRGERSGGGGNSNNNNKQSKSPEKEATPTSSLPPTMDKESSPSEFTGIYKNEKFTWALTSLIGVPLRVQTLNKEEYEGILRTFSPDLEIVLEQSHKIDPNNEDTVNHQTVHEKHVFPLKKVIRYYAKDVDMEYAMKESFLTDTQISQTRMNGDMEMRELEMWQPDDGDQGMGIEDDLTHSNGWSANEMFAKNEQMYGVTSSYDPNLSGYTTQLNRDKMRGETEREAARIAAEIDGEGKGYRIELENGDDNEEERFSAVHRPVDNSHHSSHHHHNSSRRSNGGGGRERESPGDSEGGKPQAYIPPNKRNEGRGGYSSSRGRESGGGRSQRTPPPSRYDNNNSSGYDDRDHRGQRDDRRGDRYGGGSDRHGGGSDRHGGGSDRHGGGSDRHGGGDRDRHGGDRRNDRYNRDDRGYGRQDSYGKKHDYQYSDDRRDRDRDRDRGGDRDRGDGGGRGYRGGGGDRPGSAADARRDDRKSIEKVSPLPPHEKSGGGRSPANNGPESLGGMADALPQREGGRRKQEKSKDQIKENLHHFHENFNLKISDEAQSGAGANIVSPSGGGGNPPTVSINANLAPSGDDQRSPRGGNNMPGASPRGGANNMAGASPRVSAGDRSSPRNVVSSTGPPPHQHQQQGGPPPGQEGKVAGSGPPATPKQSPVPQQATPTAGGGVITTPIQQTAAGGAVIPPHTAAVVASGGGVGQQQQQQQQPPPPQTPTTSTTASAAESTAKKSSLNPNAKEFTLNANAKEFTPKFAMAPQGAPRPSPTPPRAQTPVQNLGQIYHNIIPVQAQPLPPHMVSVALTSTQQQRPLRPNSKDGLRADLAGPPIIQHAHHPGYYPPPGVAAAAAAAGQQIQYIPQPAPQAHTQIMRMQMVPPAGMSMIPANMMSVPISQHSTTQVTGHALPPGSTLTATPPNPAAVQQVGGAPAPSPGPPHQHLMGYPPGQAPQMILMPAGAAGIPAHHHHQFHPHSAAPPQQGGPPQAVGTPGGGPGAPPPGAGGMPATGIVAAPGGAPPPPGAPPVAVPPGAQILPAGVTAAPVTSLPGGAMVGHGQAPPYQLAGMPPGAAAGQPFQLVGQAPPHPQ
eukprot:TRINITY_DN2688_c0_g2_i6.p1 TRINITY_DN2688_c0_g2~~TRINITY_DN2688_c0_g2_i6.p1  ORF type:complete len:1097 (-),score=378.91 TRINITY_DN2688_c0_g2_i6:624-3914(-)